ncbi:MAG TPA: YebC/PmpR family DNA-binding transcriptional regulator, partial [Nitrospirota bacterium]|nr:YebC/PmpR family DNA-binding transcriptional regulator [Nitrospirota bacterium]
MSGHSKWATTKHKKAAADSKRGKVFTKITKEITVAARLGGGDPGGNPRLRTAVAKAKAVSMPADNIKRAIQKGTGELPGVAYEEITYEGYGPGGVALVIEVLTDNKNRTVSEIRHILDKLGGKMGENGCVSWMFHKKGYLVVSQSKTSEEKLMTLALDAGAEDMQTEDDNFVITTAPNDFEQVKKKIEEAGIVPDAAEITMLPQTYV